MDYPVKEINYGKDVEKRYRTAFGTAYPYAASFPPEIPAIAIKAFTKEGDVVLEPFSGRGTTALEALLLDRKVVANDLSKVAFTYTHSRTNAPNLRDVFEKIRELETTIKENPADPKEWPVLAIMYHKDTLKEILTIRRELMYKYDAVSMFIKAMTMSILHGKKVLSIDMPRHIPLNLTSLARKIKRTGELPPYRPTIEILEKTINDKTKSGYPYPKKGIALNYDARKLGEAIEKESIDFVVTSPPYIDLMRYGEKTWIQQWFIGSSYVEYDEKTTEEIGSTSGNEEIYFKTMREICQVIYDLLKPDAYAVFIVGSSKKDEDILRIPKLFAKNMEKVGFKIDAIYARKFDSQFRRTLDKDKRDDEGIQYTDGWIVAKKGDPEKRTLEDGLIDAEDTISLEEAIV